MTDAMTRRTFAGSIGAAVAAGATTPAGTGSAPVESTRSRNDWVITVGGRSALAGSIGVSRLAGVNRFGSVALAGTPRSRRRTPAASIDADRREPGRRIIPP